MMYRCHLCGGRTRHYTAGPSRGHQDRQCRDCGKISEHSNVSYDLSLIVARFAMLGAIIVALTPVSVDDIADMVGQVIP